MCVYAPYVLIVIFYSRTLYKSQHQLNKVTLSSHLAHAAWLQIRQDFATSAGTLKFSGGAEKNLRTHRKPNHNHERLQQGEKATKDREVGQPERCNDEEQ